jgi:hypothetical protein
LTETPPHDGSTIQRLSRLEDKVDQLAASVEDLKHAEGNRRSTDESRLRKLEDQMLIWDTRWLTIGTLLTRVFGVSLIGAAASILSIILAIIALEGTAS